MRPGLTPMLITALSIITLIILSGCNKICDETGNINYKIGPCVDETTGIVGTYTGVLIDSVPGTLSTPTTVTARVTKVNDGEIQITVSGAPSLVPVNAELAVIDVGENGYYFTVPQQTNDGKSVSGAATVFGTVVDGYYVNSSARLGIYFSEFPVLGPVTPTSYISFVGTHQ